jgi:hypothetical protein
MAPTRVYLEEGKRWVFAAALDWPGWCRRGRGEVAAIEALMEYGDRYAAVAGPAFKPGRVSVVGRAPSRSGMADFGAPGAVGPWDDEPFSRREADRHVGLLVAGWAYLDGAAAMAPSSLRKGPRGDGRDRDAMLDHVREAERAYSRKVGCRIPPRTPWPEHRSMLAAALRAAPTSTAWPARYAIRRCAWHALDHAWEMEDRADEGHADETPD